MANLTTKVLPRKDKQNSNGLNPVILQISFGKKLERISLGFSVKIEDFDFALQRVKKSVGEHKNYNEIITNAQHKSEAIKQEIADLMVRVIDLPAEKLFKDLFKVNNDDFYDIVREYEGKHGFLVDDVEVFTMPKRPYHGPRTSLNMSVPTAKYPIAVELIRKLIRGEDDPKIREVMDSFDNDENEEEIEKFKDSWVKYLKYCQMEKRPSTSSRLPNFMNILEAYTSSRGAFLTFSLFTEDFGFDFKHYLLNEHFNYITNEKGVSNGTLHNIQKSIAAFLNWAFKKGHHNNLDFKRWNTKKPKTDLQYLNEVQLVELRSFELPIGGSLEKSRDLWLFSAYSGLRYGDIQKWTPSYVTEDGVIKYVSQKTRKLCMVGLNSVTEGILAKYNGVLPIQNSALVNRNIKEILRMMGYDSILVNRTIAKGTSDIVKSIPLCDAITVHSAKRSFINLMISKKVQIAHLSSMIGNDVSSLMVYYKNDIGEMKRLMDEIQV